MNEIIKNYIGNLSEINEQDFINRIRETLQNIVLIGFSRGGFFKKASFYGGTALRIFYGLDRFSEDLDFTLDGEINDFSFEQYFPYIEKVANSYGFTVSLNEKGKESNITSAFLKTNTYLTMINFNLPDDITNRTHRDQSLRIKFEVDHNPAIGFNTEYRRIFYPDIASIKVLDDSSLFAGKIAAILCRSYKNRVKGRDYYDYLFYVKRKTKINILYLKNKLIESGMIDKNFNLTLEEIKKMLEKKFTEIDYKLVVQDVMPFIKFNESDLSLWSKDLFIESLYWIND